VIFFYSNEHEPIHVHARKGEFESKVELVVRAGTIAEIIISNVGGREPISGADLGRLKEFIVEYANEIVQRWVDYFVLHKDIEFRRITKRIE